MMNVDGDAKSWMFPYSVPQNPITASNVQPRKQHTVNAEYRSPCGYDLCQPTVAEKIIVNPSQTNRNQKSLMMSNPEAA